MLEVLGAYLETARLIARRTAEMHVALAAGVDDPAFAPEPFTAMYQRSLYQSMRGADPQSTRTVCASASKHCLNALHDPARRILQGEEAYLRLARRILEKVTAVRIRCHGDYHLKHLVSIGNDFLIVDFEGEADRPLNHRRRKRSPIRDLEKPTSIASGRRPGGADPGQPPAPRMCRRCGRGRDSGSGGRRLYS